MANSAKSKKLVKRRGLRVNTSRRNFVKFAFCALPVIRLWAPVEIYAQGVNLDIPSMLRALLDILIPKDTTPSATELGVDRKILGKLERYKYYSVLVEKGCLWFEQQSMHIYKTPFLALQQAEQVKLMQQAEKSGLKDPQNNFFRALRQDAYTYYYSDPRSWEGLVYAGPPQPSGFPDFNQRPVVRAEKKT